MLESLQIAEKLLTDFKKMRKEVFDKLYEITEKELKNKADLSVLSEIEARWEERMGRYAKEVEKHRGEMMKSVKKLAERMGHEVERARSPVGEIDTSAILSKRGKKGFK